MTILLSIIVIIIIAVIIKIKALSNQHSKEVSDMKNL